MKSFREFRQIISERVDNPEGPRPVRIPGESFADYTKRLMKWSSGGSNTGLHPDLNPDETVRKSGKTTNVSGQDIRGKTPSTATPPKQPTGGGGGGGAKPPSSTALSTNVKPPTAPKAPGLRSRFSGAGTAVSGVSDFLSRKSQGQSTTRAAGGAVASSIGWQKGAALGAKLGAQIPGPAPVKAGGAFVGGVVGGLGGSELASRAYDVIPQGPTQKDVDTAAQKYGMRKARQVASKSNTYGATKGSGLTGIGGQTVVSKDKKGSAFMSTGAGSQRKTVELAKTQLIRDPKSGKQVVGDLAFKGGKATYLARPSTASRDSNATIGGAWRNVQRGLNIGGQRERDVAAAKQEYRTALRNTQTYQKKLGITPQQATAQKLPGRGVGPAKVGPKIVGPKIVGPAKVGPGKPKATPGSLAKPA